MAEKDETIVDVNETIHKAQSFYEKNGKQFNTAIIVVVALIASFFAYNYLYQKPKSDEAAELIWKAEYYFEIDSLDLAINGDGNYFGFDYIANEYGGTKTGELAKYYLGVCYLNKGEFLTAIDYLEDVSFSDEILGAMTKGAIGDAYVELGDLEKAISNFDKAVNHSDNGFSAPIYLMKKAIALERLQKFDKALACYKTIKKEYPNSVEGRDIDKYLARAESYIN